MERMDMSVETQEPNQSQNSETKKGWLEIAERVMIQIALKRFNKAKAAEVLGMASRTLATKRKKFGMAKKPEIPTNREIFELLRVLPRTAIESFLLETAPDEYATSHNQPQTNQTDDRP